jgi:predicted DNA-binding transcriptional regulator AlpA
VRRLPAYPAAQCGARDVPEVLASEAAVVESADSKVNGTVTAKSAPDKGARNGHRASSPRARCLDVAATAIFLGVQRRTVWRLVEKKTLRPIRLPGMRKVLFDVLDLEALILEAKS